jgi:hypothetical protein
MSTNETVPPVIEAEAQARALANASLDAGA